MSELVGFRFEPPPGFIAEESTFGYRLAGTGRSPGPSFMVQSRPAKVGATIESLATNILTELAQTLPELTGASQSELTFTDGGLGVVLAYTFVSGSGPMRQYHALRLHQARVCSVLLTVPVSQLTEANAKVFIAALSSVTPI